MLPQSLLLSPCSDSLCLEELFVGEKRHGCIGGEGKGKGKRLCECECAENNKLERGKEETER